MGEQVEQIRMAKKKNPDQHRGRAEQKHGAERAARASLLVWGASEWREERARVRLGWDQALRHTLGFILHTENHQSQI